MPGADDVLVGVPALRPPGRAVQEGLHPAAAVRLVQGEPCAVAGVHAGLAAGFGGDGRDGDRRGGRRQLRGPAGCCPRSGPVYDGAGGAGGSRPRAPGLGAGFAGLAVELGGEPARPCADAGQFALAALSDAFEAAAGLPGWLAVGCWRFASSVSGGRLIAASTIFLVVGRRRFMPPVPP